MYQSITKPFFDKLFALLGLIVLSPLFLFICLILIIFQRGAVFFIQKRIGKNNVPFNIIKFRTMKAGRSDNIQMDESQRITPIGHYLRRSHFDELPQLWNILMGQLSFIGPRPLLPEYLDYYTITQASRHMVMPGIAGLSQVLGGNTLPWNQRLRLDAFYAKKCSLTLDLKIVRLSLIYIFKSKGKHESISKSFIEDIKERS